MFEKEFDITVAVLTRNNEDTLEFCLDAIVLQSDRSAKVELLVFDNGSTDKTIDIIKKYGVKYRILPKFNIPQLRNMAVRLAQSEIIGFVDSDCIIGSNWISRALQVLKEPDVSITGYKYSLPGKSTWLQKSWYSNNKKKRRDDQLIPGGNFVIKKKSFWSIGGFDEKLETGEDADLLDRARNSGLKIVSDPGLVNLHLGFPKNLLDFYRKEKWYGKGTHFHSLLKGNDKPTLGAIAFFLCILFSFVSSLFLYHWFTLTGIGLALCLCIAAAIHRRLVNGVGHSIVSMTCIYAIYFLGRISSLIELLFKKVFEKKESKIKKVL